MSSKVVFHCLSDVHGRPRTAGTTDVIGPASNAIQGYRDVGIATWKLAKALADFDASSYSPDFLLVLGDLLDRDISTKDDWDTNRVADLASLLTQIEAVYTDETTIYHVLGNHDLEMSTNKTSVAGDWDNTSADFAAYVTELENAGGTHKNQNNGGFVAATRDSSGETGYYTFVVGDFQFIVMDSNGAWDITQPTEALGEWDFYNASGDYQSKNGGAKDDWTSTEVGWHADQLTWLATTLATAATNDRRVCIFSHVPMSANLWDPGDSIIRKFFMFNQAAFHAALTGSAVPNKHIVCISAHAHAGAFNTVADDIRFWNLRGMVLGTTNPTTADACLSGEDYDAEAGGWRNASDVLLSGADEKCGTRELDGNAAAANNPEHNSYYTITLEQTGPAGVVNVTIDNYNNVAFGYTDNESRDWLSVQPLAVSSKQLPVGSAMSIGHRTRYEGVNLIHRPCRARYNLIRPDEIAGIHTWFDANVGVSVTAGGAADGLVDSWTDRVSGTVVAQSTAEHRPDWNASVAAIGGQASITFAQAQSEHLGGSSDGISFTEALQDPFTVWALIYRDNWASGETQFVWDGTPHTQARLNVKGGNDTESMTMTASAISIEPSSAVFMDNWRFYVLQFVKTNAWCWVNGVNKVAGATFAVTPLLQGITFGDRYTNVNAGNFFDGSTAGWGAHRGILNERERQIIQEYFRQRYRLPWDIT